MLQLRLLPQDDFLLAHMTGLVSVDAWHHGLSALGEATRGAPFERLVVDLTGLVGWLGIPERTAVGAMMATHLAMMKRVALYIQREKIAGVVEAEARRNGLDLCLFDSYDEAVLWALSSHAAGGDTAPYPPAVDPVSHHGRSAAPSNVTSEAG